MTLEKYTFTNEDQTKEGREKKDQTKRGKEKKKEKHLLLETCWLENDS